jgi:hypothetical protein
MSSLIFEQRPFWIERGGWGGGKSNPPHHHRFPQIILVQMLNYDEHKTLFNIIDKQNNYSSHDPIPVNTYVNNEHESVYPS